MAATKISKDRSLGQAAQWCQATPVNYGCAPELCFFSPHYCLDVAFMRGEVLQDSAVREWDPGFSIERVVGSSDPGYSVLESAAKLT